MNKSENRSNEIITKHCAAFDREDFFQLAIDALDQSLQSEFDPVKKILVELMTINNKRLQDLKNVPF